MKKIVQINLGINGSTGRIINLLKTLGNDRGYNTVLAYSGKKKLNADDFLICNSFFHKAFSKLYHYSGMDGAFSYYHTKRFIRFLRKFNPDIIHLHNIHSNYINLKLLFEYIKKSNVKVFWTLHDCWAFTGRCAYFDMNGCDRWKNGCGNCPCDVSDYPHTVVDKTAKVLDLKKRMFGGVKDLTVITPSEWLAGLAKQSFLNQYKVKVINNGIDLTVFKPIKSNFRERYNIGDKYIVLGVAFGWGPFNKNGRKGRDVFEEIARTLDDRYCVVMVGTDEVLDSMLPPNIISIHRTHSQSELAEIYTAADVFVNPTREENFPTVNIEALACGTPVITFNTGGSPEIIDESCGIVVEKDDTVSLIKNVVDVCENKKFSQESCINRAKRFNKNDKFSEYLDLYD